MTTLSTAYAIGAMVIEKHFTDDKNRPGNDHYHAMDPSDLRRFKQIACKMHDVMGKGTIKKPLDSEEISRKNARRSIVINTDIKKGEKISEKALTYKRPAAGISTLHWLEVIGKTAVKDLKADQILKWSDIT